MLPYRVGIFSTVTLEAFRDFPLQTTFYVCLKPSWDFLTSRQHRRAGEAPLVLVPSPARFRNNYADEVAEAFRW